jgi:hypothetical protein
LRETESEREREWEIKRGGRGRRGVQEQLQEVSSTARRQAGGGLGSALRRTRRCLEEEGKHFFADSPLGFGDFWGVFKTAHTWQYMLK